MCPDGLALYHQVVTSLLQYVTKGCPVNLGRNWTKEEISAAVEHGPHSSTMEPDMMAYLQEEVKRKEEAGQCKIYDWNSIKDNLPSEMKVSPISVIPHKSRAFQAILDLLFALHLLYGDTVPCVNKNTVKTAPAGAIDQIGHILKWLIYAFSTALEEAKIFMAKWDVKDGFGG
mmetsp:Transcript_24094/g.41261  ORF Transcript_24094/g.41261 Transcript_24094/m.41261 type:complete len:173 (-) Transcript_24094:120-638(-)